MSQTQTKTTITNYNKQQLPPYILSGIHEYQGQYNTNKNVKHKTSLYFTTANTDQII